METLDYIVVGQGIAGSCLALELLDRGAKLRIFDESWRDAACLVAAGVINPITGKRLVKSWRSGAAHPYAKKYYGALEGRFRAKFYSDKRILQLCRSEEERELWLSRAALPDYAAFAEGPNRAGAFPLLNDSEGSYFITHSAWVNAAELMSSFKRFFLSAGALAEGAFDFSKLSLSGSLLEYSGVRARRIVFCDGWRAVKNPFFSWLPYRPAKGEIITVKSDAEIPPYINHRGNWLMKSEHDTVRAGSTRDRENLNADTSRKACCELLKAAENMFREKHSFEVVGQSAGIRPCTATTRPHLGAHPADSRVLSFNGFGSKGYALSPYFARHFCDWLCGIAELDAEADLSRHVKKFYRRGV